MSIRSLAPLALALMLGAPAAAQIDPRITSAETLIGAMHDRYADRWYSTLSFVQTTTQVQAGDSVTVEEWREWAVIPGRLRIEMGPPEDSLTVIYARDSTFVRSRGRVVRRMDDWNVLMIVGFDVYRQPVERTLQQLRRAGIDLSRFHVDSLDGVPVYVVGAQPGDSTSMQFAIEAERLLFMRLVDPIPDRPGRVQHVWFRRYEPLGEGWIAPEVEVLVDGRRVFHEVYANIRIGEALDEALFDPDAGP